MKPVLPQLETNPAEAHARQQHFAKTTMRYGDVTAKSPIMTDYTRMKTEKRRKCWIKEDTLQLVDERRHARAVSNTNRRRELDKQVQQQLRRDKREWLNKQCQEIDEFDRLRKAKQLYKQVNSLKTNTFKARQSSILIRQERKNTHRTRTRSGTMERVWT